MSNHGSFSGVCDAWQGDYRTGFVAWGGSTHKSMHSFTGIE